MGLSDRIAAARARLTQSAVNLRGQQCADVNVSTGSRCTSWSTPGADACTFHVERRNHVPASLTAAVSTVQIGGVGWQTWRPGSRTWQSEAWRLYDITGALRFVANWVGNSVSRCRLYVAEVDDTGEAGKETEDAEVAALASTPLGSGPAKDEALRLAAINLFVPGECYIIAESETGDGGDDCWYVISGQQMRRSGDQLVIRRPLQLGGGDHTYREGIDLILRVHTPHPADTDEADSPTRSAIPDLREIEALRKREFAELDSRLAGSGLLLVPEGMSYPHGDDDPNDAASFSKLLGETMGVSLTNRASAQAMVPIITAVPMDALGKIQHLTFWSELSEQLLPLREAAVTSLAQSLDVPAEILLGQADSNHWTAWQISEDAVSTQIVPILSRIADALTTGYLQGALEAMGLDPDKYVYAFDTAPLTTRPNRSADALNYHQAMLLSDEAAVEAGAFRQDQMPKQEERLRRIAEAAALANPDLLADPLVRDLLGIEPLPPTTAAPQPPGVEGGEGNGGEAPPGSNPIPEPRALPQQTPQSDGAAVVAAAGAAVRRALTLAGSRLVPHNQRDRYAGTPRWALHARHGAVTPARGEAVLRGAWEDLPELAADLGLDSGQLERLLHGFALELLTAGLAYDHELLRGVFTTAMRGRRLDPPLAVAA